MGDGRPGEPTEAELTDRQGQRSGTGFSKLFPLIESGIHPSGSLRLARAGRGSPELAHLIELSEVAPPAREVCHRIKDLQSRIKVSLICSEKRT